VSVPLRLAPRNLVVGDDGRGGFYTRPGGLFQGLVHSSVLGQGAGCIFDTRTYFAGRDLSGRTLLRTETRSGFDGFPCNHGMAAPNWIGVHIPSLPISEMRNILATLSIF
jgi:hypothetical protein